MQAKKQSSLIEIIRERLLERIVGSEEQFLPPVRALAAQWGVSSGTVAAAARTLREAGRLSFYRGARMRITGRETVAPRERKIASAERICQIMRESIANGSFQHGAPLPKVKFYALEYGVSEHTVQKALARLETEGLIYRRGRRRHVGPQRLRTAGTRSPVILILRPRPGAWLAMGTNPVQSDFCKAFDTEARLQGVRLELVSARGSGGALAPAGHDEVSREILKLGRRYDGTLIIGGKTSYSSLERWIARLMRFQRPIVWFDAGDADNGNDASSPDSRVIRCRSRLRDRWAQALDAAARAGCARALGLRLPRSAEPHGVVPGRYALSCSMIPPVEQLAAMCLGGRFDAFVNRLCARSPRFAKNYSEALRWTARKGGVSGAMNRGANPSELLDAILAQNRIVNFNQRLFLLTLPVMHALDQGQRHALALQSAEAARMVWLWFAAANIPMPGSISLVCLEDRWMASAPITSVNSGLSTLGFEAFHAIRGDFRVPLSRENELIARPTVVDRGSL